MYSLSLMKLVKTLEEFTVLNSGEVHKFDYSYRIGILNNEVINLKNQLATFLTNQKTLDKLINIDVITPMKVNELVDKKNFSRLFISKIKLLDLKEVSKIEKSEAYKNLLFVEYDQLSQLIKSLSEGIKKRKDEIARLFELEIARSCP